MEMDCIFCKIINGDIPSYTIYENEYVKCFLDINPLSNGHTLIIPKKHFKDAFDIDEKYLFEIHKASKIILNMLNEKLKPNGFQLVQNNGIVQEVKHYHLHIIPKYNKSSKKDVKKIFEELQKNC
jgi:histidine triad (HIT) family protein